MKMTKSEFTKLVKESLRQLIAEGELDSLIMIREDQLRQKNGVLSDSVQPPLAQKGQNKNEEVHNQIMTGIKHMAAGIARTSNQPTKLYEDILLETAKTSLQQYQQFEKNGGYTDEQKKLDDDKMKLFGPAMEKWAALAKGINNK